jgi:hypothetical protein
LARRWWQDFPVAGRGCDHRALVLVAIALVDDHDPVVRLAEAVRTRRVREKRGERPPVPLDVVDRQPRLPAGVEAARGDPAEFVGGGLAPVLRVDLQDRRARRRRGLPFPQAPGAST